MSKRRVVLALIAALTLTAALACKGGADKPASSQAAKGPAAPAEARTAIEKYLVDKKGIDVTKMDIVLSNFTEKDGGATCDAYMTLKGAPEGMPAYDYTYTLAKAEGAWAVTASQPKGGAGHAAMPPANAMPEGHPSVEGMNPHAGVEGAPPLASGHGSPQPAPAEAPAEKK